MITFVGGKHEFDNIYRHLAGELGRGNLVNPGEWQALQREAGFETLEVEDVSFAIDIDDTTVGWQDSVKPNLPWAEDHFQERVSELPHNPPPSHEWWPFAMRNNSQHQEHGKFSHTYPERFWPKYANETFEHHKGIRYPYGDLEDVITLLGQRTRTRQAYLPVWFPEDTGAVSGQRVPCTLGYHFMIRDVNSVPYLKCVYYIRSCDFFRHFRDDVYMAGRLTQHIAGELAVVPGRLVMHISSLHIFEGERARVLEEAGD